MFTLPANPTHYVTLLRHGESEGNAARQIQGQGDYPLNAHGREQIARLAERWQMEGRCFDRIIASSLSRAENSARLLSESLGVPLEVDSLWQERHVGKIQGLSGQEARKQFPLPEFPDPYTPVGETGESQWALWLRAGRAVESIMQRPAGRYLVVSHGGLLNLALHVILGISLQGFYNGPSFEFSNASFADLEYSPARHRWSVKCLNDHAHLKADSKENK